MRTFPVLSLLLPLLLPSSCLPVWSAAWWNYNQVLIGNGGIDRRLLPCVLDQNIFYKRIINQDCLSMWKMFCLFFWFCRGSVVKCKIIYYWFNFKYPSDKEPIESVWHGENLGTWCVQVDPADHLTAWTRQTHTSNHKQMSQIVFFPVFFSLMFWNSWGQMAAVASCFLFLFFHSLVGPM